MYTNTPRASDETVETTKEPINEEFSPNCCSDAAKKGKYRPATRDVHVSR
jgi:hypothetical protein